MGRILAPILGVLFTGGLLLIATRAARSETTSVQVEWLISAITLALWGSLATLLLRTRDHDPRARLFALTAVAVGATTVFDAIAMPEQLGIGTYVYLFFASFIYLMHPAVIVHMTSMIPDRNELFVRQRWLLALMYLGSAFLSLAFFIAMSSAVSPFLPWHVSLELVDMVRVRTVVLLFALSGVCGLGLLGYAAWREPTVLGRRQAVVVFAGLLPWTANLVVWARFPEIAATSVGSLIGEITVLLPPVALFVSLVGYRLFEVSAALRRGMIYGGAGGLLLGIVVIFFPVNWAFAGLLVVGGFLGQPLLQSMSQSVDRRFFREREALQSLRRRLITSLAEKRTLDDLGELFVNELCEALGKAPVALYLNDVDGYFRARAATGRWAPPSGIPLEWLSPWADAMSGGRAIPRQPALELPALTTLLDAHDTAWIVPVTLSQRIVGVVLIGHSEQWKLENEEVEIIEEIARQASAMIENVRLLDLASTDPLTRLPRRHVAEERLSFELERSRRSERSFAIALADIDRFKAVNDTYGHASGDVVLERVARTLAEHSRRIDVVARWGGEEFMLIFAETDADGAQLHAENMRKAVEALEIHVTGGVVRPTISFGLCVDVAGANSSADLVARVDEALYRAKQAGRNRVEKCG